jgi:hypothetical protein
LRSIWLCHDACARPCMASAVSTKQTPKHTPKHEAHGAERSVVRALSVGRSNMSAWLCFVTLLRASSRFCEARDCVSDLVFGPAKHSVLHCASVVVLRQIEGEICWVLRCVSLATPGIVAFLLIFLERHNERFGTVLY